MKSRRGENRNSRNSPSEPAADSLHQLLQLAREAAHRGAQVLSRRFGKIDPCRVRKKGPKDFVTDVDHEAEEAVVGFLQRETPEVGILAEERPAKSNPEALTWVIDPLDGTTNFIHTYPLFAVSVGLVRGREPLVGVVVDPLREEEFTALRGGGAFLNGSRLHVSQAQSLCSALVATGFPFRAVALLGSYLRSLETMIRAVAGVRRDGSAALDLCYVACGRVDAFWELKLSAWDIAAGTLMVTEAGGRVSDFSGGDSQWNTGDILASNGHLHPGLTRLLRESFPSYA